MSDSEIGTMVDLWDSFENCARAFLNMTGLEAMQAYDRGEINYDCPTPDATQVAIMMPSSRPSIYTTEPGWTFVSSARPPRETMRPNSFPLSTGERYWKVRWQGEVVATINFVMTSIEFGEIWSLRTIVDGKDFYRDRYSSPQDAFEACKAILKVTNNVAT